MKNKKLNFFGYIILLIGSIFLGYFLIVFSVFFFLGNHVDKEYDKGVVITAFVIIFFLILLFIIFFLFTKIIKNLLSLREDN
jgi:hypothetical protein